MRKLKIDDPLDAFAVHGACGVWGMIAVGLFTAKQYSYAPAEGNPQYTSSNGDVLGPDAGLFMTHTRGVLFGTQIVAIIIIVAWVAGLSGAMFFIMNKLHIFRVSDEVEQLGADVSKHGGSAYPEQYSQPSQPSQPKAKAVGNSSV
jgi:Amt family ammonium transporter